MVLATLKVALTVPTPALTPNRLTRVRMSSARRAEPAVMGRMTPERATTMGMSYSLVMKAGSMGLMRNIIFSNA